MGRVGSFFVSFLFVGVWGGGEGRGEVTSKDYIGPISISTSLLLVLPF